MSTVRIWIKKQNIRFLWGIHYRIIRILDDGWKNRSDKCSRKLGISELRIINPENTTNLIFFIK